MSNRPVFESPEEYQRAIACVKADPKRDDEGFLEFCERIAKAASLMKPEQLPLRERVPGEDDE